MLKSVSLVKGPIRESSFSIDSCNQEASPLLSGSYNLSWLSILYKHYWEDRISLEQEPNGGLPWGLLTSYTNQGIWSNGKYWQTLLPSSHPKSMVVCRVQQISAHPWKICMDGSSNAQGSSIRVVLESPKGIRMEHSMSLGFQASNNKAKYEALLVGFWATVKVGATEVEVCLDSQLVVSQIQGAFMARDERMSKYLKVAQQLQAQFEKEKVTRISQGPIWYGKLQKLLIPWKTQ